MEREGRRGEEHSESGPPDSSRPVSPVCQLWFSAVCTLLHRGPYFFCTVPVDWTLSGWVSFYSSLSVCSLVIQRSRISMAELRRCGFPLLHVCSLVPFRT